MEVVYRCSLQKWLAAIKKFAGKKQKNTELLWREYFPAEEAKVAYIERLLAFFFQIPFNASSTYLCTRMKLFWDQVSSPSCTVHAEKDVCVRVDVTAFVHAKFRRSSFRGSLCQDELPHLLLQVTTW